MTGQPLDQPALVEELLSGLESDGDASERERVRRLASELVADWAKEADRMPDPAAVLRYQKEDLQAATARLGGNRIEGLELTLLRRRADQVNAAALSLAGDVIDGRTPTEEGRDRGKVLLEVCEQLSSTLAGYPQEAAEPIMRSVQEAMLDALYVVEGKAMSPRLARAHPTAQESVDQPGPPDIRP